MTQERVDSHDMGPPGAADGDFLNLWGFLGHPRIGHSPDTTRIAASFSGIGATAGSMATSRSSTSSGGASLAGGVGTPPWTTAWPTLASGGVGATSASTRSTRAVAASASSISMAASRDAGMSWIEAMAPTSKASKCECNEHKERTSKCDCDERKVLGQKGVNRVTTRS